MQRYGQVSKETENIKITGPRVNITMTEKREEAQEGFNLFVLKTKSEHSVEKLS